MTPKEAETGPGLSRAQADELLAMIDKANADQAALDQANFQPEG